MKELSPPSNFSLANHVCRGSTLIMVRMKIQKLTRLMASPVLATAIVLLFTGSAIAQFAKSQPPVQPPGPAPTAVVLDFSVAPRVSESREYGTRRLTYKEKEVVTEKDSRGWWLGRQDIYVNANIGRIAADLLTDKLRETGLYKVRSRHDLKYYYADKKDLIKKKYGKMSDDDLKKAILLLDPVSIGREMGVDKVIVGQICDSELRKAVAPGSFASVASFNVAVFDVASGRMEFEKCYRKIAYHSTQYFQFERVALAVTRDLAFHRMGSEYAANAAVPRR